MSVSPPPGGSIRPLMAEGGGPGEITRKLWPPSTEPNQVLRWVPVPVGPLTKTRPRASIPMSGSPLVWMASTMVGVSKLIAGAARAGVAEVKAGNASTRMPSRTLKLRNLVSRS